jgi:ubiquitin C-terminal hydrolase
MSGILAPPPPPPIPSAPPPLKANAPVPPALPPPGPPAPPPKPSGSAVPKVKSVGAAGLRSGGERKARLGSVAAKSATGFVGLKNQGATCYLNSLVQALFVLPEVRDLVYSFDYDASKHGSETQCQMLQLQRLFAHLELCDLAAIDTGGLTRSFGWTSADVFEQQDVQELFKVLLDRLEEALDEGAAANLRSVFKGSMTSFVQCAEIGYESFRREDLMDISLRVEGNDSLMAALRAYNCTEALTGPNKYRCQDGVLRDAQRGSYFEELPPILIFHLQRFVWDADSGDRVKLSDRLSYTPTLSSDDVKCIMGFGRPAGREWTGPGRAVEAGYNLCGVLVHVGGTQGGHYYAYIRPSVGAGGGNVGDKWVEFNDDNVREVEESVVLSCSGCGEADGRVKRLKAPTAYMLVYRAASTASTHQRCTVRMPDTVRQDVLAINAQLSNARAAEQADLDRLACLVRWNPEQAADPELMQFDGGGGSGADSLACPRSSTQMQGRACYYETNVSKTACVADAATAVLASLRSAFPQLLPPELCPARDCLRLRIWDSSACVPGCVLPWKEKDGSHARDAQYPAPDADSHGGVGERRGAEGAETKVSDLLNANNPQRLELFLEMLPKDTGISRKSLRCLPPYIAGGITLRVMLWVAGAECGDSTTTGVVADGAGSMRSFGTLSFLSVQDGRSTCGELAELLREYLGVALDSQQWVVVLQDRPVLLSPADKASEPIEHWGLATNGASLYLANTERLASSGSHGQAMLHALESLWFKLPITLVSKGNPAEKLQVDLDTRASLDHVRRVLSDALREHLALHIPSAELRLYLAGRDAGELKQSATTVSQAGVCPGDVLCFEQGMPLQSHEYSLSLVQFRVRDVVVEEDSRVTVVVSEHDSVAALYRAVAAATGLACKSLRVRKLIGGGVGVGSVLRHSDPIAQALTSIHDGLVLAMHSVGIIGGAAQARELARDEVSVFVRLLLIEKGVENGVGAVCKLGDGVEVVVRGDMTDEEVGKEVAAAVGMQDELVLLAAPPSAATALGGDPLLAVTLEWLPLTSVLLGTGDGKRSKTVCVREGAVVCVRDARQKLLPPQKSSAIERGVTIAKGPDTNLLNSNHPGPLPSHAPPKPFLAHSLAPPPPPPIPPPPPPP